MLKRFLTAWMVLISAATAFAMDPIPMPVEDPTDIFPMRPGLIWEYTGSPIEQRRRIGMMGYERMHPPRTYIVEGFQGRRRIRKADEGVIVEVEIAGDRERELFEVNAPVGASWVIEPFDNGDLLDGTSVQVLSRSAEVAVPFGTFANCVHLGLKPNPQLADAGVSEMWFAPGYGLVKWTEQSIAGPQTFELMHFEDASQPPVVVEPGDSTVVIHPGPMPPIEIRPMEDYENRSTQEQNGVRYELGTVQPSYAQGDGIEIQYRVTALDRDVTFQFNSTRQYDFRVVNEQGETVWVWSANMGFGDALTSLPLKVGESVRFVAFLNLDAETIPGGQHTLIGFLPTSAWQGETVPQAETEVKVPLEIVGNPVRAILSGVVMAEDGSLLPVPAWVSLSPTQVIMPDGGVLPAQAVQTTRSGTFDFRGVTPGVYSLTVRAEGFQLYAQRIDLAEGETHLEIALKREDKSFYSNVHEMVNERFVTSLATDRQAYAPGDSVYVRYRLTNISGEDIALTFPSGQVYDLTMDGSRGRVWTWSETRSFIQAVSTRTLLADDDIVFEEAFVLRDEWVKESPSFLLRGFLAITPDQGAPVSREATEAIVKFAVDGWIMPPPLPPGPLVASLWTDREAYAQGDVVTVTYRLANVSDEPVTLQFSSGQRYDLVLHNESGAVWGWSWTRSFTAEAGELVLAPRDTFAFEERVPLANVPDATDGMYVVRAYMTALNADGEIDTDRTEAKVRFWVGDRPIPEPPILPPVDPTRDRLSAQLDASIAESESEVVMVYRVVNRSGEAVPLVFGSGQEYDLVLDGPNGELWRWSEGRGFDQALHARSLAPGDSLIVRETISLAEIGESADGKYELRGFLTVMPEAEASVTSGETHASLTFSVEAGKLMRTDAQPSGGDVNRRPGDFDGDGAINFNDFLRFARAFGKTNEMADFDGTFDLDGNNAVDFDDFLQFAAAFGN